MGLRLGLSFRVGLKATSYVAWLALSLHVNSITLYASEKITTGIASDLSSVANSSGPEVFKTPEVVELGTYSSLSSESSSASSSSSSNSSSSSTTTISTSSILSSSVDRSQSRLRSSSIGERNSLPSLENMPRSYSTDDIQDRPITSKGYYFSYESIKDDSVSQGGHESGHNDSNDHNINESKQRADNLSTSISPNFPFAYGKTMLDTSIATYPNVYKPEQKNLRYLTYKGRFVIYDTLVNTPLMVIYHIGKNEHLTLALQNNLVQKLKGKKHKRPQTFKVDYSLSVLERVGHNDYRDVTRTYSRGHFAPKGDFIDPILQVETFMTTNIAPQVQKTFNDKLWNDLEDCVREWSKNSHGLTIIVGVIHKDPKIAKKLNGKVQIPSHFYKIIIDESSMLPKTIAFLMENRTYDQKKGEMNLKRYITSMEEIGKRSGFKYLIAFPEKLRKKVTKQVSTLWPGCK